MKKELSVVLPAYNEEANIEETVESVVGYLRRKKYRFEVLIVNDGSADATLERARGLEGRLPEVHVIDLGGNHGKGQAVKEGVAHAHMVYCLFMDADNATSVEEWEKFEPFFEAGARAVVASRRLPASLITHHQPISRRLLGKFYRRLCEGVFSLGVSDLNCGFKAYETALAKDVYRRVHTLDWAFDAEVFCILKKQGVKVEEVPVSWEHRPKNRRRPLFQTGFETLNSLWRLKRRY